MEASTTGKQFIFIYIYSSMSNPNETLNSRLMNNNNKHKFIGID